MATRKKKTTARKKATSKKKTVTKKKVALKKKKVTAKKRKTQRNKKASKTWLRWLLASGVLLLLLFTGYTVYLAQSVRVAFEGKRWSVPARVYARPLELYVGAPVSVDQLRYELQLLGYRKVSRVKQNAQWSTQGNSFVIQGRDFHFWDGKQTAQTVRLSIAQQKIVALDNRSGQPLDLVRLEPAAVGSIYPAHKEDRILLRREDLPQYLVAALLAVEDRRFYAHYGIDLWGIARAMLANIKAGAWVQGGSTLTQQLVKNFVLTHERSLRRKVNEALMALIVDSRYSKDEILEAYANEIFLGQDGERAIHGFGLAAQFYFNRPLAELRLPEVALLVGLVKGASYYNPRRHPQRAKKRRDLVIDQMQQQGFIEQATAQAAKAQTLGVSARGKHNNHRYPAFIQLVRKQLRRDYREEDLTSEGLRIFTTLNPWDQRQAEKVLTDQLARVEKQRKLPRNQLQAAMVVAAPQSGEVQAVVGGRRAGMSGFNRALDAQRPIGSLVKPAVYLTALAQPQRYQLNTLLTDEAVRIPLPNGDVWQPRNFDRKTRGQVSLQKSLADSLNLPTVRLGMELGVANVVQTLHNLGIEKDVPAYPSILLGSVSLSPLQVTQLYQTIAAGGFRAPLRAIREVLDSQHQPLQRYPLKIKATVPAAATALLTRALHQAVQQGTGRGLKRWFGEQVALAGKTGTTNDQRDSWFAGFSDDRVAVVWVGRDDNQPTKLTGSSGALPIFGRFMRAINTQPLLLDSASRVEYRLPDKKPEVIDPWEKLFNG
jgi:penicillin-binding protein 1B